MKKLIARASEATDSLHIFNLQQLGLNISEVFCKCTSFLLTSNISSAIEIQLLFHISGLHHPSPNGATTDPKLCGPHQAFRASLKTVQGTILSVIQPGIHASQYDPGAGCAILSQCHHTGGPNKVRVKFKTVWGRLSLSLSEPLAGTLLLPGDNLKLQH